VKSRLVQLKIVVSLLNDAVSCAGYTTLNGSRGHLHGLMYRHLYCWTRGMITRMTGLQCKRKSLLL